MKRSYCFLIGIFSAFSLFSQASDLMDLRIFDCEARSPSIYFKNGEIDSFLETTIGKDIKAKYDYQIINGAYYLTIYTNLVIKSILLFNEDLGVMYINGIMTNVWSQGKYVEKKEINSTTGLLKRWKPTTFIPRGGGDNYYIAPTVNIVVSSFLQEGNQKYSGENLKRGFFNTPWVEGVDGNGVGENILLEYSAPDKIEALVISNGFVSLNNPNLYLQNNRIKKIRVDADNGKLVKEFDILDTANLQTLHLNGWYSKIEITILDVYQGTMYNDTCLNMLVGVSLEDQTYIYMREVLKDKW